MDLATPIGSKVEEKGSTVADRGEVEIEELLRGFDLVILIGVVEPAGAYGHVAFTGNPELAIHGAGLAELILRFSDAGWTSIAAFRSVGGPAGVVSMTVFVADPADIGANV